MSKNVKTRIQLKADSSDAWTRASNNGFKVLDREAIFYTDADTARYPIPMKMNLTGEEKAPSELDFIAECASNVEVASLFGEARLKIRIVRYNGYYRSSPYTPNGYYSINAMFDKNVALEQYNTIPSFINFSDGDTIYIALPSDSTWYIDLVNNCNADFLLTDHSDIIIEVSNIQPFAEVLLSVYGD